MQAICEDIRELQGRGDLYEPHLAVLDDHVGEVLPDVNMLGSLSSAHDVVSPLDAGSYVLKYLRGAPLSEAQSLKEVRRYRTSTPAAGAV